MADQFDDDDLEYIVHTFQISDDRTIVYQKHKDTGGVITSLSSPRFHGELSYIGYSVLAPDKQWSLCYYINECAGGGGNWNHIVSLTKDFTLFQALGEHLMGMNAKDIDEARELTYSALEEFATTNS